MPTPGERFADVAQLVEDPPTWAVAELGPVPDDPDRRAAWARRARHRSPHHELVDHDDANNRHAHTTPSA